MEADLRQITATSCGRSCKQTQRDPPRSVNEATWRLWRIRLGDIKNGHLILRLENDTTVWFKTENVTVRENQLIFTGPKKRGFGNLGDPSAKAREGQHVALLDPNGSRSRDALKAI